MPRPRTLTRPVLLAVVSDVHAGGTTALCPDEIALDDGGKYVASKAQRWLMQCWRDYWRQIQERRAKLDAELYVAMAALRRRRVWLISRKGRYFALISIPKHLTCQCRPSHTV